FVRIHGAHLDREPVLAWVAVANKLLRPLVQVLFPDLHAFAESLRWWLVQDLDASARTRRDLDPVQPWSRLRCSHARRPNLTGRKRVAFDRLVAVQLWR